MPRKTPEQQQFVYRSCTRKKKYNKKNIGKAMVGLLLKELDSPTAVLLHSYHCTVCKCIHIGHAPREGA